MCLVMDTACSACWDFFYKPLALHQNSGHPCPKTLNPNPSSLWALRLRNTPRSQTGRFGSKPISRLLLHRMSPLNQVTPLTQWKRKTTIICWGCKDNGKYHGNYYNILGIYWDNIRVALLSLKQYITKHPEYPARLAAAPTRSAETFNYFRSSVGSAWRS